MTSLTSPGHARLLLVDDDGALSELLSEFLELQGIEVVTAASGRTARTAPAAAASAIPSYAIPRGF